MKLKHIAIEAVRFTASGQDLSIFRHRHASAKIKSRVFARDNNLGTANAFRKRMMAKTSLFWAAFTLFCAALIVRLRELAQAQVPVGYQDEKGFHYGKPSSDDCPL